MTPPVESTLVDTAVEIAREAGRLTLQWFQRSDLAVDQKRDGSPITAADLAAETLIRTRLAERFPGDGRLGEEHDDVGGSTGRTWVIDPIDGTKAFTRGVPLFSNLLALVDEHGPAIGVINLPALGETVWAGRGLGAFRDGRPCQVSRHADLEGAYLCTSGTGYWPPEALRAVIDSPAVFRTWGDGYGYALVATGRAEAMIDPQANPWDVAPMAVIIAEAGGCFSTTTGDDRMDAWRGGSGLATNGVLHPAVLDLLDLPSIK